LDRELSDARHLSQWRGSPHASVDNFVADSAHDLNNSQQDSNARRKRFNRLHLESMKNHSFRSLFESALGAEASRFRVPQENGAETRSAARVKIQTVRFVDFSRATQESAPRSSASRTLGKTTERATGADLLTDYSAILSRPAPAWRSEKLKLFGRLLLSTGLLLIFDLRFPARARTFLPGAVLH
jgi:hypothetical protein